MTRRTVRIAASIAISVVFLALAVRNVDWGQAMGAVWGANYLYVLLMLPRDGVDTLHPGPTLAGVPRRRCHTADATAGVGHQHWLYG